MTWFSKAIRAASSEHFETWKEGGVCPCLNAFDNGTESRATLLKADERGVRRLTPVETERLMGFPDGWTAGDQDGHWQATLTGEDEFVVSEVPDSVRYEQLGNAVAVPVVEWIVRRMLAAADA